ncbi:matrilin-4 [Pundamilia nyererei]|uniref:Matrilin-4 n=1 Tax=Pundamilia nyererei TaxID=303518 RepID=A0A9Y3S388_9CICH|nr:PREDICTED: matrilin-4 [Pundamilia nyererei]
MKMRQLSAFILLTLAVLATARPKTEPAQKCKTGPVDLVFLIDSSRSVRPHEFETMRKFMIDIINTLDIGLNATRVGVVQYSSQVRTEFTLKTHARLSNIVKAINQIIPLAQGTMTGLAIRYMMNEAFTPEAGDRPKVPNVAVIVTDGRPQDRVAEVAAEAREKGIEIYAVGVARADMTSLRAMASPPFEDHVFLVESFDLIHQFGIQFQDKLCVIDYCSFGNHSCDHECVSVLNGYRCRCNEGYRLLEDSKTCQACKSANIDLVLLIDGSKSVRPQNFELVKKFVNQVVDSLDVSAHGTRVGLVQYSSRVRTEFPLNMYHTADEIKAAVMKVEYMEKGTMTGLALKHMLENSFSEAEGARPLSRNIPRIGLVFTDGRSQDDITEYAKKAKEAGITMYAVGVGKAVEDELREIASEPVEKHFYYTTDFTAISTIAENLKLNVCPEESQGEIEVKDPCACESLVEFQQATMNSLEQVTQKLAGMTARLEQLENQLFSRK